MEYNMADKEMKNVTPEPHIAEFRIDSATIGALSFLLKYNIIPTMGIKNDKIFSSIDGESFGFKL